MRNDYRTDVAAPLAHDWNHLTLFDISKELREENNWIFRAANVHVLILCVWPRATFDPQEILRGFTFLRKLMIANSNLTRLSTAFPSEMQFLEVENCLPNAWGVNRKLCLDFIRVAYSNFHGQWARIIGRDSVYVVLSKSRKSSRPSRKMIDHENSSLSQDAFFARILPREYLRKFGGRCLYR